MVGDLTVAPGATFTIEPGCTIIVSASDTLQGGGDPAHIEFTINGALVCQGDAADSIWFRSDPGCAGCWSGLVVASGGSAALSYCSIAGAQTGLASFGTATLANSQISSLYGVGQWAGQVSVQRCLLIGPGKAVGTRGIQFATVSDPQPADPQPTIIRGFAVGVAGCQVSNAIATDCQIGFQSCTCAYCTAYGNESGFWEWTAKNCISAANSSCGFLGGDVSFSDSWSNPNNYNNCRNLLMTANWNPFFMNAPSDLRLRPDSIFMGWSDTGGQIGAFGPGAGPPVAAHNTSWGRIKALYR
jgi:hypothetical protein